MRGRCSGFDEQAGVRRAFYGRFAERGLGRRPHDHGPACLVSPPASRDARATRFLASGRRRIRNPLAGDRRGSEYRRPATGCARSRGALGCGDVSRLAAMITPQDASDFAGGGLQRPPLRSYRTVGEGRSCRTGLFADRLLRRVCNGSISADRRLLEPRSAELHCRQRKLGCRLACTGSLHLTSPDQRHPSPGVGSWGPDAGVGACATREIRYPGSWPCSRASPWTSLRSPGR